MNPGERLVTALVTLSVPDNADAEDAATLIAVAADTPPCTWCTPSGSRATSLSPAPP